MLPTIVLPETWQDLCGKSILNKTTGRAVHLVWRYRLLFWTHVAGYFSSNPHETNIVWACWSIQSPDDPNLDYRQTNIVFSRNCVKRLTEEATLIGSSSIGSGSTAPRLMAAQNRIMRMELRSGLDPFLSSPARVPLFTIKEQSADAEPFYDWSCVLWLSHINLACVEM